MHKQILQTNHTFTFNKLAKYWQVYILDLISSSYLYARWCPIHRILPLLKSLVPGDNGFVIESAVAEKLA